MRIWAPEPGPRTLVEARWAGRRLAEMRGAQGRPIGESWEFSTLPERESFASGRPLSQALGRPLDLLAKLIDTGRPLSVQVHPGDDPRSGRLGKEEAWVVLRADPDAAVRVGVRDGVDATAFADRLRAAPEGRERERELLDSLCRLPVRTGSVVLVPAGAVHAIGGGILLAEIQQPTDRTYRLYDYGSGRELHVRAGLEAMDPDARAQVWEPGAPARTLRGRNVELRVLPPGEHSLEADSKDRLVIPVGGGVEIEADDARESLPPAALRLVTPGDLSVSVPPESLAVVGAACRP
ncbi:MAG: class I mannose-6-phosphate isomerase [Proteobacteria bacterium]|nr:class I mannose-6-phosphate isomerase [Pseudomonadota bacterium]